MLLKTSIRFSKYHTTLTNGGKFGKSNSASFIFSHLLIFFWHCDVCKPEKFTDFLEKDVKLHRTLQWSSITEYKFFSLHFPVSGFIYSNGHSGVQIHNLNIEVPT